MSSVQYACNSTEASAPLVLHYLCAVCARVMRLCPSVYVRRVIDQTSSGINNRQSVCLEKKTFQLATVCFKSCSCPYKVVIIISADLSQRRNCDTKEDADD